MRNALQATAALLALAASASAAGWRVGVIAGSARDFEAAAAAVSRADDVELVNLRGKDAPATGLSALVAASQAMTSAEVKRVEDYARSGGLVIVMGDAGEYDDADGDGKVSSADKRAWALSALCGLSRSGVEGGFAFVRLWHPHPLFLRFPSSAPMEWKAPRSKAAFAICETARPLASGLFVPRAAKKIDGLPALAWYAATRGAGESAYLAVNRAGKGVAVYVAENLIAPGLTPAQQALAASLLSPLAGALRGGALPEPPTLGDAHGNLVHNGDMEALCVILDKSPANAAVPPYSFPLGWQYNAWGGGKSALTAVKTGKGHALAVEYVGPPGEAASAACVARVFHPTLRPTAGQEYTLTFRVKSNRPTRVSLWGKRTDGKPWRLEIGAEPPADTWRQAKHVFRPPAAIFSGAPLQFGCSLDFLMPGDGRTELDDVALKPSAGDGE